MISLKLIRENPELVRENIKKKQELNKLDFVDKIIELDSSSRKIKYKIDQLRAKRNKLSQEINTAKKKGLPIKDLVLTAKSIPDEIKSLEQEYNDLNNKIRYYLSKIPNIMHPAVPQGKDDSENVLIKKVGVIQDKDFEVINHVELCEKNNWVDFDASALTSGNGFYYLLGDLALLNQALIRFAIDFLHKKNYMYIEGPLMLHKQILDAAMDTAGFKDTIYKIEGEDLNLIGTSEHSILGLLANRVIPESQLPLRVYSYSMAFRKEIGSHGINEKGLWRTHQFNKVEQFIFTTPETSWDAYDELLNNSEELLKELGLPYRVVEICTGDLALWKARSADVEVYRPTTKSYGEIMSLSNCTDFQARDLNIKVLRKNNSREIIHTLNNTALATSRIMVAILENYQNKDGSVTVPTVLRKYMFNQDKLRPNTRIG